ncbi:MAG: cytidine/deoxycytidylate deaminase family protein [Candidatus Micrarchaeia archaeon]
MPEEFTRPSWDEYFKQICRDVSLRASCRLRKVGALIVINERILSTGYNGSPRGLPHCLDVGCKIVKVHEGDEVNERCDRCLHAEQNAIIQCALHGVSCEGATLYTTARPCRLCAKMIINAGITRVVYEEDFKDKEPFELLKQAGVKVEKS